MIEVGCVVNSSKGHDFGRVYLVTKVEKEFAWCVDGKYRLIDNPKKKRIKHLADEFIQDNIIKQKLIDNCLYDFEIDTFIRNSTKSIRSNMHKNCN